MYAHTLKYVNIKVSLHVYQNWSMHVFLMWQERLYGRRAAFQHQVVCGVIRMTVIVRPPEMTTAELHVLCLKSLSFSFNCSDLNM